jgi:NADPH-dependent ferric siderophore reductase
MWVHRAEVGVGPDPVVAAVAALDFPDGRPQVFVHGEAHEVRAVRKHLLGERGVTKDGSSISPYWRRGDTDESWRQVKRQWTMETEADI